MSFTVVAPDTAWSQFAECCTHQLNVELWLPKRSEKMQRLHLRPEPAETVPAVLLKTTLVTISFLKSVVCNGLMPPDETVLRQRLHKTPEGECIVLSTALDSFKILSSSPESPRANLQPVAPPLRRGASSISLSCSLPPNSKWQHVLVASWLDSVQQLDGMPSRSSSSGRTSLSSFGLRGILELYQSRLYSSVSMMSWQSGCTKSAHVSHSGWTM